MRDIVTRTSATRNIIESVIIGVVLTALSYIIGFAFFGLSAMNWLEVFAVATSYSCTYLCVKERRINYPIGAVSTAAYALLFFQAGLFASMVLNLYLVPALVYGWFRWGKDIKTRLVEHVSWKMVPIYVLVTAAGGYGGAVLLGGAFGATLAFTDSFILAGTILAQFLLDNKKIETWIVWAVVNVFAIYTYFTVGLYLVVVQYVFFLFNTLFGYILWNRSMNQQTGQEKSVIHTSEPDVLYSVQTE